MLQARGIVESVLHLEGAMGTKFHRDSGRGVREVLRSTRGKLQGWIGDRRGMPLPQSFASFACMGTRVEVVPATFTTKLKTCGRRSASASNSRRLVGVLEFRLRTVQPQGVVLANAQGMVRQQIIMPHACATWPGNRRWPQSAPADLLKPTTTGVRTPKRPSPGHRDAEDFPE